jgi:hypothetical protein
MQAQAQAGLRVGSRALRFEEAWELEKPAAEVVVEV